MRAVHDFGEVGSWEAAMSKVSDLYNAGEINGVATVSLQEYRSDQWFASILQEGGDIPPRVMIEGLAEVCPSVYPGNSNFKLLRVDTDLSGMSDQFRCLVVVYLKSGEQF
ncbi:MAG: hypothetical protein IT410_04490 [Candidatus Doudnabacteria bacterium]|nr:hypothetical protein [Candidatus Doudnabacteria bacterium]